jgi:hypothetical protein
MMILGRSGKSVAGERFSLVPTTFTSASPLRRRATSVEECTKKPRRNAALYSYCLKVPASEPPTKPPLLFGLP